MKNVVLDGLQDMSNFALTQNGGLTHKTTKSDLMDMFAMGAAMRQRNDEDVILMFRKAFAENPVYALKCLFYVRDVRGGQGERRFFRIALRDLANTNTDAVLRNIELIPEFGRWDDLYCLVGTPAEKAALGVMRTQLALDLTCETPSLLAKWLKSENASSRETARLANKTRVYFNMTHRDYRKVLSHLREKINIVERLMSENRWDEIEFDKIPSRAGLIYKNAFARRDIIKAKYEKFAKDETTTVNAGTLYPYEVVEKACAHYGMSETDRAMVNKYWENLTDYFQKANFNGLAMVDTSASMRGTPLNVAISLGMYLAERTTGPFAGHYISFSSRPKLVPVEGVDFVDKVARIYRTNICENTNIESAFNMLLAAAIQKNASQEDMPENIIVISDMEFDCQTNTNTRGIETLMEAMEHKYAAAGYQLPALVYWNVNAMQANIPHLGNGRVSYVSGFSPSIFETIMSGKSGMQLMYEVLDGERYSQIN